MEDEQLDTSEAEGGRPIGVAIASALWILGGLQIFFVGFFLCPPSFIIGYVFCILGTSTAAGRLDSIKSFGYASMILSLPILMCCILIDAKGYSIRFCLHSFTSTMMSAGLFAIYSASAYDVWSKKKRGDQQA